ncbi:MAG: methylated-DNA--[protein]-cysteine S-methyltransferase [Candidatus Eiseniibacteriota bacterium]
MRKTSIEVAHAKIKAKPGRIWILATGAGLREIRLSEREGPTRAEMRARGWKLVRRRSWTDPLKRALEDYLRGTERRLDLPLDLGMGTEFQRQVWQAARKIPYGVASSYEDVAKLAGHPRASRAVGNALGANPVPIVVPCHRVIHADRSIGGFSSGLTWKRFLLELERGQLEFGWKPKRRSLFHR